jgi:hypothetical protein
MKLLNFVSVRGQGWHFFDESSISDAHTSPQFHGGKFVNTMYPSFRMSNQLHYICIFPKSSIVADGWCVMSSNWRGLDRLSTYQLCIHL